MSTHSISLNQFVRASQAEVYRAFTNSTYLREWLSDVATVHPHPGGRLYLAWNSGYYACGEYTSVEAGKGVAFTWFGRGEPAITRVQVSLKGEGDGTRVEVEHSGLGNGAEWEGARKEIRRGWEVGLENLASVLETGEDLRFTRRPMMGITMSDFNQEVASKLGVPVNEGIRLDSTLEGMGARAAGLQGDDVVVALGGQPTTDWASLTTALQRKRAGEQIEVVYYRGGEKRTANITLSGRPIPEIPATPKDLADAITKIYVDVERQLDDLLAEVSEEEASYKPDPEVWSVKENLAHLIHGERVGAQWISDLIGGHEPFVDDWSGNIHAQAVATVAVYPTLQDLRQEFHRSWTERVELITRLPDEFTARKGSYWRLAYQSLEGTDHFTTHMEQMGNAIKAAREAGG